MLVDESVEEGQGTLVAELLGDGGVCAVLSDRLEVPAADFVVYFIFQEVEEVQALLFISNPLVVNMRYE